VNESEVEPKASPLGRYDSDDTGALFEVRLLNMPLRLLAAGREHHDEVMREFAMLALDEDLATSHVPTRMLELIDVLGRRYAAAAARPDAEVDAALERGERTIDLVYHVPAHVTEAAEQLDRLMAEADEFCREQQLLALERPPLQVRLARWYLDEFRRQIAGEPPRPWDGPYDDDDETA
jgi:cation transport regulator ChaC